MDGSDALVPFLPIPKHSHTSTPTSGSRCVAGCQPCGSEEMPREATFVGVEVRDGWRVGGADVRALHQPLQPQEDHVLFRSHLHVSHHQYLLPFLVLLLHALPLPEKLVLHGRRRGNGGRYSVAAGGGGGGGGGRRGRGLLLAGAAGKGIAVGGEGVVVLGCVGNDEHRRVGPAPLHLLPRQAPLRAAAPVIPPVLPPS